MYKTLIATTIKYFSYVLAIYSLYIFLRGHNEPGGGFIGGLILSLAAILYHSYYDSHSYLLKIKRYFHVIIGVLILAIMAVALTPLAVDQPFLKGLWTSIKLPLAGKFSSILLFDTVIYLLVATGVFQSYLLLKNTLISDENGDNYV